jgi:hypothetical protein
MKIKKSVLEYCFIQAKLFYENGELDKARDFCDCGIKYVAIQRSKGMDIEDKIEGYKLGLWLERFWMFLENKNLLLG